MERTIIHVENLSKVYRLYDKKSDRVKEALSLTKRRYYREFYALDNISFDVIKGETIGIVGTNGSGKSTLLKILSGVSSPSSGAVSVDGKIAALLELGTGFNPEYTGVENIMLNGTMMGYTQEEMEQRKQGIIDFASIGDYINQPVKNYSSGMFARLAFAVAVSVEPEILIVDEALSVGDMRFQIKCMDRMKQMMENGTTILYVSHDINSIRRFCKRTLWLSNGKQVAYGETNQVADQYLEYLRCQDENQPQGVALFDDGQDKHIPAKRGAIAEIVNLQVIDETAYAESKAFAYDTPVKVTVSYVVTDDSIKDPVLGVALFNIDGEYICGLNTLLDGSEIPWELGENRFSVVYPEGLCVLGGRYYFDCAIMDQTASVFIDHKKYVRTISVSSGYKAEGKLVIPHTWVES